jgi:hypothetical protein
MRAVTIAAALSSTRSSLVLGMARAISAGT